MRSPFLKPNNPNLKIRSSEISENEIASKETQKIIEKMLKIAYGEQRDKKKPIMVGLAAPQIGTPRRIILVDTSANGKGNIGRIKAYINPDIVWSSKKRMEWYEGCYSTGKICGIVSRPVSIRVKTISIETLGVRSLLPPRWDIIEEEFSGYVARIFQHEIDHLNGTLFFDHIKNPDHLHEVEKHEFPLYRNKGRWRYWPKKHPLPIASNRLKKV